MSFFDIVNREFTQRVRDAIKTDDLIATGQLRDSVRQELEIRPNTETVRVYAESYILELRDGEQSKNLPTISDIEKWVEAKGLSGILEPWAVLKAIERDGTTWDRQGGSPALKDVINPEVLQNVINLAVKEKMKEISGIKWL